MEISAAKFSSMKEFSFEEAQKMLGSCALAFIGLIDEGGQKDGNGIIWKSLQGSFWVKAKVDPDVVCGSLGSVKQPERKERRNTGKRHGYFGH